MDSTRQTPENSAPEATPNTNQPKPETETSIGTPDMALVEAKAEAAKNLDGWQRASAEFINYRKRMDKERTETYANATVDTFTRILPIMDDFDRAIAFVPAEKQNDTAIDGFRQIHRKLLNQLESVGVKQINPVGESFNPAFHEAIGQDDGTGKPAGMVTVVLQKGYMYGEKVLRAALVRVAN